MKNKVENFLRNNQITRVQGLNSFALFLAVGTFFLSICTTRIENFVTVFVLGTVGIWTVGYNVLKGVYFKQLRYGLAWFLPVWFLVLSFVHGDYIWIHQNGRNTFIWLSVVWGIVFPFASVMKDKTQRVIMDLLCFMIVVGFAILLWISFLALFKGENIVLFNGKAELGATYTYTGRMKLKVLELHYYATGRVSVLCFFLTIYLAVTYWSKRIIIPAIILESAFVGGILATYSRTCIFTFVGGLLMVFYLLVRRSSLKKKVKRWLMIGMCVAMIPITLMGMNYLYKLVNSIRDVWYGIGTFTNRTDIWWAAFKTVCEQPVTLLFGLPLDEIAPSFNMYLNLDYTNTTCNGYLQTLLTMGVLGLIVVVLFTIKLIICCFKVFFNDKICIEYKFMVIIPVVLMVMNLFVSLLFVRFESASLIIANLCLALFSGYIMEVAEE